MKSRLILPLIAAGLIGGCATTSDPRQGGLFGGVHGLSSGSYDRRVQEREENLERLRAMQQELKRESTTLAADKQQSELTLNRERERLAALNADVRALERTVAQMAVKDRNESRRVAEIKTRVAALKGRVADQGGAIDALDAAGGGADALEGSGRGNTPADQRRRQLEAQRASLQKEYDELLQLTLQLAQ